MSRALLVLANDAIREKAVQWIAKAPKDTRVMFQGPVRTLPQNARLWASLTDVSQQAEHGGRKYDADTWKIIFMSALGREMIFISNLDGTGMIPIGHSSSNLSKSEMSDLLELIYAWGAERGVVFHEPSERAGEAA